MSILTQVLPRNDEQYRTSSEVIQHLHHTLAARPSSASQIPDLTGQIILQDRFAAAHGGFADVYIALWHREQATPLKVAVKVLRSQSEDEDDRGKRNKRLRRELKVWQRLNHDNVLPLYGTTSDFGPYSSMVCPWVDNGSLSKYLERRGATLMLRERFGILCDVASGLSYLHLCSVVHGDLSGSNVLIDDGGRARVADFGMSKIAAEFQGTSYFTSSIGGAIRWAAPELYCIYEDHTSPVATAASDVYSYGSLTLQVLTGQVPYHYIKSDLQVVFEIHKGLHPRCPTDESVNESHWDFITRCWSDHASGNRPSMAEVLNYVQTHASKALWSQYPFSNSSFTLPSNPQRTSEQEGICQDDPHLDNSSTSVKDEEVAQRLHGVDETSVARSPLNDELKSRASIWSNVMNSGAEKSESAELPGNISPGSNGLTTAMRPCTAPVLYTPARSSYYVGPQVISRTSTSGSGTITCPDELPAPEIELLDESPFAFSVPIVTSSQLPYSPPIDIVGHVAKGSSFPNATVWDVCGSWP
ncbi:hypothetical protein PILCRDRAFT_828831 [Piloderma croceum F 1598]|uniref:Protein kinase domain-containing protein n=1 Tax=Piloderma croceum (strain F 1598) TaxID=765440 RepID=A0A0C3F0V3_PILCF|nr:hypothetical protein PILCRDRAFT_828831 [Piloderma croceum F 1598]